MSNYVERLITAINSPNKNISNIKGLITNIKQKKANINDFVNKNRAPIHHAVQKGDIEILELLIANGADVNLPTSDKLTPLCIAINSGHNNIVQALLKRGANPNCKTSAASAHTLIHDAAQKGNIEILELLIANGADVNLPTSNLVEDTPLHTAITHDQNRAIHILLKEGANPNRKNKSGVSFNNQEDKTPLHHAIGKQNLAAIFLLLSYGASLRIKNQIGDNAIAIAEYKLQYQQIQAEEANPSTKKPAQTKPPISRARKAFYILCGITLLLSTLTIGVGLLLFYTHAVAPTTIILAAGGFAGLVVLSLLGISTAFKPSAPVVNQKVTNPILSRLKDYRAQTRTRIAYYTANTLLGLFSASILGTGIAMYFNLINLPFIPFVAVGGTGVLLAAILITSFAIYKRWSENRMIEDLIQAAEQAKQVRTSSYEEMIGSNKKSRHTNLLTANSPSNPNASCINGSNYQQYRIPGIESQQQNQTDTSEEPFSGYTVPGAGYHVSSQMIHTSIQASGETTPSILGSFSFAQQVEEEGYKVGAPEPPKTNSDPSNLSISMPQNIPENKPWYSQFS